jgi:hypothetical protein
MIHWISIYSPFLNLSSLKYDISTVLSIYSLPCKFFLAHLDSLVLLYYAIIFPKPIMSFGSIPSAGLGIITHYIFPYFSHSSFISSTISLYSSSIVSFNFIHKKYIMKYLFTSSKVSTLWSINIGVGIYMVLGLSNRG